MHWGYAQIGCSARVRIKYFWNTRWATFLDLWQDEVSFGRERPKILLINTLVVSPSRDSFWLKSTFSAVGKKTLHPTLHLQHRRHITAHTLTHAFSNNNWQRRTSFICSSPVYSPEDYSTTLPILAHSTEECRCRKDSLHARTAMTHTHIHTHSFHVSLRHTQLVSQLTHSLLFWVVLERYCQGDDRGNFPLWKNAVSSKCSSMPLQGRTPVFRSALLFPLLVFDSRSGHPFQRGSRGTFCRMAWTDTHCVASRGCSECSKHFNLHYSTFCLASNPGRTILCSLAYSGEANPSLWHSGAGWPVYYQ